MVEVDFEMVQPRGRRVWRVVRPFVVLLGLLADWFLGVAWVWEIEYCDDCGHTASITEYRVFGIPVHSEREDSVSLLEYMYRDLGHPCQHEQSGRDTWRRQWGLLYCACPCYSGTHVHGAPADRQAYELNDREHVHAFAERHPEAAADLLRLWRTKDLDGFKALARRIRDTDENGSRREPTSEARR